jgi:general secretion pathway protein B
MSYILDALRRADAERERGAVPNIHAQPYAAPSGESDSARATPPWLWIALALLAVAVLTLGWKLFAGDAPREQMAAAPVTPAPAPTPAQGPAPAAAPSMSPQPPVTSTTPPPAPVPLQPVQALPITPPTPASRAAATPSRAAASKPAARTEPALAAAASTITTPTTTPAGTPASTPASAVERIYAVSELPEDVRRSLPVLPIGGAMYSKNAADRMLIVGGQILHEGDTIAPDLKLEQIRLKSAVFRFKAYRYEVSY